LKSVPLLIDTNLLVLFVVGTAAKEYIAKHKKLTASSTISLIPAANRHPLLHISASR